MITCCVCNHSNRPGAKLCANCRAPLMLQDKYRITKLLGRGGYGAVYQAEHTGLGGALYAIKELNPDPGATPEQQRAASEQFRLEASILAKLNHATLPKVMDFFHEAGRDYLVMEYVEGETLQERLAYAAAPLPEAQVLAWAHELCDVLAYLHTREPNPVIHRDVKPSNIKIAPDGKLKLIDFGIAKLYAAGAGTQGAARAVSPPYSPIEQYGKGTDARSDIYALGVTLYHLLTNHLPPEAPDRASEAALPVRQRNPALAANTEAIVMKAMAEISAERFQSAAEMKQALTAPAASPTLPVRQAPVAATQRAAYAPTIQTSRARSNSLIWLTLALGILFVLVICGVLLGIQVITQQQAAATVRARETSEARATAQTQAQMTAGANARATATAVARATMVAEAYATTTARARATTAAQTGATATAAARATATAQANATIYARATATTRALSAALFGPKSGNLSHSEDSDIETLSANISVRDFVAEARFYNPYDRTVREWDYGFGFRSTTGGNRNYRIAVESDGDWYFYLTEGAPGETQSPKGRLDNLDVTPNGSNRLRIEIQGNGGSFWVNGKFISDLDVARKTVAGDVWVGTGFFTGHEMNGKTTRYENFTVWQLP